jgi:flagella basal body P-ring formation protein FlgA
MLAEVYLLERVTIPTPHIRLGDIATIISDNIEIKDRLRGIPLGRIPRYGRIETVNRNEVRRQIEILTPDIADSVVLSGSDNVVIQPLMNSIDHQAIVDAAQGVINDRLASSYTDFSASVVDDRINVVNLPSGTIRLEGILANSTPKKRMCVWVNIFVDDQPYQRVPVWFRVSAHQKVLAAKRDLTLADTLSSSIFNETVIDITTNRGTPVDTSAMLEQYRLSKPVKSGHVLVENDIVATKDVDSNSLVRVVSVVGRVTIETSAIATQSGAIGERIAVRPPEGTDLYHAIVIGKNRALALGE